MDSNSEVVAIGENLRLNESGLLEYRCDEKLAGEWVLVSLIKQVHKDCMDVAYTQLSRLTDVSTPFPALDDSTDDRADLNCAQAQEVVR